MRSLPADGSAPPRPADQRCVLHQQARTLLTVAICGAMALSFEGRPTTVLAQAQEYIEDPEAYAVYATVLHAFGQGDQFRGREIKLFQETRPPRGCMQEPSQDWQPALEDFRKANVQPRLLKEGIDLGTPHLLVTPLMIKSMTAGTTPRLEPMLAVSLSGVGFNPDKTFALVYHEGDCGVNIRDGTIDCGRGGVTPLSKIAGRWELSRDREACSWIARHNLRGADELAKWNPLPAMLSNGS